MRYGLPPPTGRSTPGLGDPSSLTHLHKILRRIGLRVQAIVEMWGRARKEFVNSRVILSVNPRAASKRTIVKPVCAPVARARQDLTRVIRAVFETAFDHHVQIRLKNRIFGSRQGQADARLLPGNSRDIHPDFPLLRQTLPGHCLDLVEGHFDALIALLSGIESRHVVTLYRIEHSVDAHLAFARSEPAQAKGGKAGRRADCPAAHIAEAG